MGWLWHVDFEVPEWGEFETGPLSWFGWAGLAVDEWAQLTIDLWANMTAG